jgi:hypothetical protein
MASATPPSGLDSNSKAKPSGDFDLPLRRFERLIAQDCSPHGLTFRSSGPQGRLMRDDQSR